MRAIVAPMVSVTQLQDSIALALDDASQGQPDAAHWPLLSSEFHVERVIQNWAKSAEVRNVPVLALKVPRNETLTANQVPLVAKRMAVVMNVCAKLGVQVRPIGHHDENLGKVNNRGIKKDERDRLHNWSPINLNLDPQGKLVLYLSFQWISTVGGGQKRLIETTNTATTKTVRAYCGETMAHLGELANRAGLTLPIVTAPHVLSLGGVLAISGHGSRLSESDFNNQDQAAGITREWPGTISASVDSATVVVWRTDRYVAERVGRGTPELGLAAAGLGRMLVVDVTLRCLDDYSLRINYFDRTNRELFDQTPGDHNSLEYYAQTGAFEVLAFRTTKKKKGHIYVAHWNRPDNITENLDWNRPKKNPLADLFGTVIPLGLLDWSPWWLANLLTRWKNDQEVKDSPNNPLGPAAKMRMYATSDAPPVTASGYCIIIPRDEVQATAKWVYEMVQDKLEQFKHNDRWGVHQYLTFECRCADLDDHALPAGALPPLLSTAAPLSYDSNGQPVPAPSKHVVLWVSVLSLNNDRTRQYRGGFYTAVERALFNKATAEGWRLRPEWAKGWGYNGSHAWGESAAWYHDFFEKGWPGDAQTYGSWRYACRVAWEFDPHGVLNSSFHEKLLPPPSGLTVPPVPNVPTV